MKTLLGYFWRGCLVLAPISATAYVAYYVVSFFDHLVPVGIPGLGFILTLALITVVGFLTSNVIGQAVVDATESWLVSVPVVKLVYSSIRDLLNAFVGDKKRFDYPVFVTLFPGSQTRVLGFVTREDLNALGTVGDVAVYIPQSYNFAGNLIIVPQTQVERIETSSSDLLAFIVSGGVSGLGIAPPETEPAPRSRLSRTILGLGPHSRK